MEGIVNFLAPDLVFPDPDWENKAAFGKEDASAATGEQQWFDWGAHRKIISMKQVWWQTICLPLHLTAKLLNRQMFEHKAWYNIWFCEIPLHECVLYHTYHDKNVPYQSCQWLPVYVLAFVIERKPLRNEEKSPT